MARDLILMRMSGKFTCAQCCVSMVTHVAMQDALDVLEVKNGSNFRDIIDALNKTKTPCDQTPRPACRPPLPVKRAIVRMRVKSNPKLHFFVVWSAGAWYCPYKGFSEEFMHPEWPRDMYADQFVEIKNVR